MVRQLTSEELSTELAARAGWSEAQSGKAIEKTFQFKDFGEAFAFMTRAALAAEKADHHPEWSNVYNRVEVTLTTHEAGGVTARDLELADAMDRMTAG